LLLMTNDVFAAAFFVGHVATFAFLGLPASVI
jgi:hypothetical protein